MFTNRVAVITGSARGIGKAIAQGLAAKNCAVIISDLDQEASQKTADEIASQYKVRTLGLKCDVGNIDECKALAGAVHAELGSLDIWVNNAGVLRDMLLIRMKDADFDLVVNVNLKGTFNGIQAATRYMMKAQYGRIINIASVAGLIGSAGQANYAAAKAGVISLTKTAAREFASRNITVNAIAPGYILTDMTGALSPEIREYIKSQVPVKIDGKPEHVAAAARFLASEEAAFITGVILRVDGGLAIGF